MAFSEEQVSESSKVFTDKMPCLSRKKEKSIQEDEEKLPQSTPLKPSLADPHTKLYPSLENQGDLLECADAEHAKYRFDLTEFDKVTEYLLENGYVVIKKVLSDLDIETGKSLLWDLLTSDAIGWDQNDNTTWDTCKIGGELHNGLIWGKGMGQSKFQWFGRKHPKVLQIFSRIWSHDAFPGDINEADQSVFARYGSKAINLIKHGGVKKVNGETDLLTSFDGIGLFTPWYLANESDRTNSGWYHIDQNVVAKRGIHTIQGYLTYYDQNESTGSTCLIPKTHLEVENGNPLNISAMGGDFIRIRKGCKFLDSKQFKKILVCCKAGDMVLWDSRTIHCNSPALLPLKEMRNVHLHRKKVIGDEKEVNEKVDLLRLVSMICMVPKYRLKNEDKKMVLKERVDAYVNKCTLSHWPTEFSPLSMEYKWNDEIEKNDIEKADNLIKSLIGYSNFAVDGLFSKADAR